MDDETSSSLSSWHANGYGEEELIVFFGWISIYDLWLWDMGPNNPNVDPIVKYVSQISSSLELPTQVEELPKSSHTLT